MIPTQKYEHNWKIAIVINITVYDVYCTVYTYCIAVNVCYSVCCQVLQLCYVE